ncbi:hypothetical protein TWF696_004353 [Orbilia brochopaga]|uniref:Uncharacterized protein n=1 Tax=Orbilia brochopaga TaxID=3140254 RepID=A0AAV9V8V5_9PEZI
MVLSPSRARHDDDPRTHPSVDFCPDTPLQLSISLSVCCLSTLTSLPSPLRHRLPISDRASWLASLASAAQQLRESEYRHTGKIYIDMYMPPHQPVSQPAPTSVRTHSSQPACYIPRVDSTKRGSYIRTDARTASGTVARRCTAVQ